MGLPVVLIHRLAHALEVLREDRFGMPLAERLRLGRLPRYVPTTTTFLKRELNLVDANSFLAGVEEIFRNRLYEFPASRPNPLILDCGANIGLSCLFFKELYPASRIIAFEPDPAVFAALEGNIGARGFSGIELHNRAVWVREEPVSFWSEGAYGGRIAKPCDEQGLVQVSSVRLKDYLGGEVDFLKLDIEGAEVEVVADCADVLCNVERMFVEYHSFAGEEQRLDALLGMLRTAGFRYHVKEALTAEVPFRARPLSCGMDLQLNIFGFRT